MMLTGLLLAGQYHLRGLMMKIGNVDVTMTLETGICANWPGDEEEYFG